MDNCFRRRTSKQNRNIGAKSREGTTGCFTATAWSRDSIFPPSATSCLLDPEWLWTLLEIVVPNCLEIPIKRRGRVAYVVARYHEHETDPVPVQIDSNGGVEFSRIEEGFEIAITPTAGPNPSARKTAGNQIESGVILARLVMRRGRWQVDRKFRRPRTR